MSQALRGFANDKPSQDDTLYLRQGKYMTENQALPGGSLRKDILRDVSRSFFLSVQVLPKALRKPIGMAYLFARAADTIADTRLAAPEQRVAYLQAFRAQFDNPDPAALERFAAALTPQQSIPAERALLARLPELFRHYGMLPESDRVLIRDLMRELPEGMVMDLTTFPAEDKKPKASPKALATDEALDRYCYLVAGTAGKFWTRVLAAKTKTIRDEALMIDSGVRYGQGLQMVNVLRDAPRDLAIGRCYIPLTRLSAAGLTPEDLINPANAGRARPVLHALIRETLDRLDHGRQYFLQLPRRSWRVRMATLWPLLIALRTLALLAYEPDWLNPDVVVRVPRRETKRLLLSGALRGLSNFAVNRLVNRLMRRARKALK
jgi:farnesyl-diphosphate farnesyltransferase